MRSLFEIRWGILLWSLFIVCAFVGCKALRDLQQTSRQGIELRLATLAKQRARFEEKLWLIQDEQAYLTFKLRSLQ